MSSRTAFLAGHIFLLGLLCSCGCANYQCRPLDMVAYEESRRQAVLQHAQGFLAGSSGRIINEIHASVMEIARSADETQQETTDTAVFLLVALAAACLDDPVEGVPDWPEFGVSQLGLLFEYKQFSFAIAKVYGARAVPTLVKILETYPCPEYRYISARELGLIGVGAGDDERKIVFEALMGSVRKDKDYRVRERAAHACLLPAFSAYLDEAVRKEISAFYQMDAEVERRRMIKQRSQGTDR